MTNGLNFIGDDEISGKKKGIKYGKYVSGIEDIVDEIREQINDNGSAIVGVRSISAAIDMSSKSETAVHRGLKFAFWGEDIVVDIGTHRDGSKVFIFKDRTDKDKLPDSLQKLIDE